MRPLEGIKIIDFTQAHAGSLGTMLLADFGAEVIKIERPNVGDMARYWPPFKGDDSGYYSFLNRGKKSITVNARSEEGKEILKKLISEADVVCENFKVGNMERLGLGYDDLKKINPKIIYASVSGYGITGPNKDLPSYDLMLQAMCGVMDLTGFEDGLPTKVGPAIGDHFSGTYLANAVCMALIHRDKTGEGQRIDIGILDTLFSVLDVAPTASSLGKVSLTRMGNANPSVAPSDTYKTKDGHVSISINSNDEWKKFCSVIAREDLIEDSRFITNEMRVENYTKELKNIIQEYIDGKDKFEIENELRNAGLACAAVLTIDEAIKHPQIKSRNMLEKVNDKALGDFTMPGIAIKLHGTPGKITGSAPLLGEDTDAVLQSAGYEGEDIKKLRENKIV
ncbi:MAG: CoA transferase [Maledivibacter sp.]|nr:CoA transferase [Maledivibacter sp.]